MRILGDDAGRDLEHLLRRLPGCRRFVAILTVAGHMRI